MSQLFKILVIIILLNGCAAVTITDRGTTDMRYRPNYEETKHFFLWGLVGEHRVNTQAICKDRPVAQLQSKFLPRDVLYATLTLGLYLPRTARVWCERQENL